MRNKIDFKRPPEELFHDPVTDGGLFFLGEPDFIWHDHPAAMIKGFAASEHEVINERINQLLEVTKRHKVFSRSVVFNSVPVLMEGARFKKSFVTINEKCLLGGAAGLRLLNRYAWENEGAEVDPDETLANYFDACQTRNQDAVLPLVDGPVDQDLPFAIECRNTFNYFHFVTESLCQLCLAADSGHRGPIYLHFPNQLDKTRDFTRSYIQALFPELADRVVFQRTPYQHDLSIGAYNFFTAYYLFPQKSFGSVDALAPSSVIWKGRRATRVSQGALAMNALDNSLLSLRTRALKAIEGMDFSHLPTRFWVTRDAGLARKRPMVGEGEMIEMLTLFGFQSVTFETLSPLEQIALMANAEMMLSYHGAGFTNMLFANPKAWVIEIGTTQTAEERWGDFWRLAHASGCRYVSFFADYAKDDPITHPDFQTEGLIPVSLSKRGLAQIMSFVVTILGHVPKLQRREDVLRLVDQLIQANAPERALSVFVKNPGVEKDDADLLLAKAEAFRALGHEHDRFILLHAAFAADPSKWGLLIQIIWCARGLGKNDAMRAALAALRDGFPVRFDAFVRDRPWFRAQVA